MKRLADLLLGKPVEEFITERRADGISYRVISRELFLATKGEVDVSDVSLRLWDQQQSAGLAS